jgi:hypothetical protein
MFEVGGLFDKGKGWGDRVYQTSLVKSVADTVSKPRNPIRETSGICDILFESQIRLSYTFPS